MLVVLGWALARDLGRWAEPFLFRLAGPRHGGHDLLPHPPVVPRVLRSSALRIAGLDPLHAAVGGAITAVVFGLAAQQTLGNLIAGMVLISARGRSGSATACASRAAASRQVEGTVARSACSTSTFAQGEDSIMVPNNVVLTSAVVPLREPAAVDLRARLRPDVKPSEVHEALLARRRADRCAASRTSRSRRSTPTRSSSASPRRPESEEDGPRLADEVLSAIASVTREGDTDERRPPRPRGRDPRMEDHPTGSGARRGTWRSASACRADPRPSRGDDVLAPSRRCTRPLSSGTRPASACRRGASGATSISARSRSIAFSTAARRPRACLSPRSPAASRPTRRTSPRRG